MHALALLESTLAEYETAAAELQKKKENYEQGRAALEQHLPKFSEPGRGRLAERQAEIGKLVTSADASAKSLDYDAALKALTEFEPLLPEYQDLASKRKQYSDRWADLQPRVPTATTVDAAPDVVKVEQSIAETRSGMESKAGQGDYADALAELEKLVKLVADLTEAKENGAQARANFEQKYAALKPSVESALAAPTDVKEIKAKQDDLAAKQVTLAATVSKNDFEAAQTQLADVQSSLDSYFEELHKSPINRDLVRDLAGKPTTRIASTYMTALAKINNAAIQYDEALKAHKGAIQKVSEKKQLAVDIAAGVFFAALGGFAGGAVSGAVGGDLQKEFESKVAQGGVVDTTKEVAKYLTRTIEKYKGKIEDPTAIAAKVGGSGTELALGIGAAVDEQGSKLLKVIEHWYDVLIAADPTASA